jgi:hypothetical protein
MKQKVINIDAPEESLVAHDELDLMPSTTDIQEINVATLKTKMVQGIYVLEAALFNQASAESERIARLRNFSSTLEKNLFDPATIALMDDRQKVQLYSIATDALNTSTNFLLNLHRSLASGVEAIATISAHKDESVKNDTDTPEVSQVKDSIRDAILEKIRSRVTTIPT